MVSTLLLHAQCSPPSLHGNRSSQTSDINRNSIRLSSSFLHCPTAFPCFSSPMLSCRFPAGAQKRSNGDAVSRTVENQLKRTFLQVSLWAADAAYVLWLFLLPYAPGDPVWDIKVVGIHAIQAPVLHPVTESLFNFVIGWTFLFAPLLFTDRFRGRFKGSLDLLWGCQMFLTNMFLIPYMAIRLDDDGKQLLPKPSRLGLLMTTGAPIVGLIGGTVCLVSIIWAFVGRPDGGFGDVFDRLRFLEGYVGSERLAYAFVWDIFLYAIFQPWLIGDNLKNVKSNDEGIVSALRFVPAFGLVAYLLSLDHRKDLNL